MFVRLGEQLPATLSGAVASIAQSGHQNPWWLVIYALEINLALALLRFIWVSASLHLTLFKVQQRDGHLTGLHLRGVLAVSLSGVREAITLAGMHAEREEIFNLARQSKISDETSRKLVREIDLVDARYR